MEDEQIIELFWERSENAISEAQKKYWRFCRGIARRITNNDEDAEECENDAYLKLWESIPPNKPQSLSAYLGRIVRNLSLNRLEKRKTQKRGKGETALALEELEECVPSGNGDIVDEIALKDALNRFLKGLSEDTLRIFMQRYWYMCSVKEIAAETGSKESRIKMSLLRTREKLREFLESEGFDI